MPTQLELARQGTLTDAMKRAADADRVSPDLVREQVALGYAVIPLNPGHAGVRPTVVGRMFRTKVNANIGRSPERSSMQEENLKLRTVVDAGADFVMDLSVGSSLPEIRGAMLRETSLPLGTVPIYEALSRVEGRAADLTADLLVAVIRDQAAEGVDFMTLHAGLLYRHIPLAASRRMGIVSRGGAILAEWMARRGAENPLFERWDEVLDVCARHDVTVSLGDGLRPGCLADASDAAQFAEMDVLGDLVQRCRRRGVQVMVEGPGHVPFDQIQMNMEREQKVCDRAPFYVLGPVVTDIAPGYDHIVASIGATSAAYYGASLLCYVTPAEHLGLPCDEDVRAGVIAFRIAAHAADIARGLPGAREVDDRMADARMAFDWEKQFQLSMDPAMARARYQRGRKEGATESDYCSMCGKDFCAIKTSKRVREVAQTKRN